MDTSILISNLTNPTLLFFLLGIVAAVLKSDLEVPPGSVKFISLYLLFSIGFRGGQELAHESFGYEVFAILGFALLLAVIVPVYSFFILKTRLTVYDAGAVAASYGSVSAVTFIVFLIRRFVPDNSITSARKRLFKLIHESLTNGSVLMVVGSLVIGLIADTKQAEGIKPFTSDIFKGFLAVFLLDMGILAAKRFKAFLSYGMFVTLFAIIIPIFNGIMTAWLSGYMGFENGNRLMLSILAASASYIAVPAAMRYTVPQADPGLYIPMALGVTFPLNITIGLPLYWAIITF